MAWPCSRTMTARSISTARRPGVSATSGRVCSRRRPAAFERIIDDMRRRAVHDRMTPEVEAEVRRVDDLVARARRRIEAEGLRDALSRPGRSLRNPFMNDLAVQFWDSQALERWAARHEFRLD